MVHLDARGRPGATAAASSAAAAAPRTRCARCSTRWRAASGLELRRGGRGVMDVVLRRPRSPSARVVKPQGRKGEVLAEPLSDRPDRFPALRARVRPGPGRRGARDRGHRPLAAQGRFVLKLEGVDSIDEAEGYRGIELRIGEDGARRAARGLATTTTSSKGLLRGGRGRQRALGAVARHPGDRRGSRRGLGGDAAGRGAGAAGGGRSSAEVDLEAGRDRWCAVPGWRTRCCALTWSPSSRGMIEAPLGDGHRAPRHRDAAWPRSPSTTCAQFTERPPPHAWTTRRSAAGRAW